MEAAGRTEKRDYALVVRYEDSTEDTEEPWPAPQGELLKLVDFGLATCCTPGRKLYHVCGSPGYALGDQPMSMSIDDIGFSERG